jgi:Cytochrome P460
MVMLHTASSAPKYYLALGSCAVVALCTLYVTKPTAQSNASPIYDVTIPVGYRDWQLIAVDQLVTEEVDQLRAQLGNEIAIKAFKEGKIPFPDGTIIAALHWNRAPSGDNNKILLGAFPGAQSFDRAPGQTGTETLPREAPMTRADTCTLARITDAHAAIIERTATIVLQEAGVVGLAQLAQQQMLAIFSVVQGHFGRDAALAMLRSVEQVSARRLS